MSTNIEPVELLRQEFARRRGKNSAYSLRAFSRALEISPARLSQILNRKRSVTAKQIKAIADALMLQPDQRQALESSKTKKRMRVSKLDDSTPSYADFDLEIFKLVADWHHSAILCLLQTEGSRSNHAWIAKRIGISTVETQDSIELLLKLGLLKRSGSKLIPTDHNLATTSDVPSAALRRLHFQMMSKAMTSLEGQPLKERDITSITMAVDKSKLDEAKTMIKDFRRKLCAFLESGEKNEVYAMNIQLFQLSK